MMSYEFRLLELAGFASVLHPYWNGRFCTPLLIYGLLDTVASALWLWDSAGYSTIKKSSERLHYGLFQLALFISLVVTRIAFLFTSSRLHKVYEGCKNYGRQYPSNKKVPIFSLQRNTDRFRLMAMVVLSFIFFGQLVEFFLEFVVKLPKLVPMIPCTMQIYPCLNQQYWIVVLIGFHFKVLEASTVYFTTYNVVGLSMFLLRSLDEFQEQMVRKAERAIGGGGDASPKSIEADDVTPILILKNHGQDQGKKGNNVDLGSIEPVNDMDEQFRKIKDLYLQFRIAMGLPLVVAFLGDLLNLICVAYMFILSVYEQHPGKLSSTEDESPYLNLNSRQQSYTYSLLYQSRAFLICAVGSFVKFRIGQIKDTLDDRVHQVISRNRRIWTSSSQVGGDDDEDEIKTILHRVHKWQWALRPMDMFNVDFALFLSMGSTVMTYVVVLLQMQISEENNATTK